MPSRRTFLLAALGGAIAVTAPMRLLAQAAPAYVLGATAVTEVFGDGQRLVGVAIEYDRPMDAAALDPALYAVEGRTVTGIRVGDAPDAAEGEPSGFFVILDLSPEDEGAATYAAGARGGTVRRPAAATATLTLADLPDPAFIGADPSAPAAEGGPPAFGSEPLSLPTTAVRNLVVDDFVQAEFRDAETGDALAYNLFVPPDRDPATPLPIVLFMHDAGATSTLVDTTLVQGLGAVSWVSPADQARHPAIVLAPQFSQQIVNDASQTTSMLDTTLHLLDAVAAEHNGDLSRLYLTGQSGGGMMSIAMMVREPERFAAAFLVACQWDPAVVAPLARQKLWVVVSEGDEKAFPGQTAIMEVIEGEGTEVSRATWSGTSTPEEFAPLVEAQAAEGAAVNLTTLQAGTVVPAGQEDNGGSNHTNTWRIAYTIPGLRDWIMAQSRER